MMKRVADYIIETLFQAGAEHVFYVPGAGCLHLTDALARKKELHAVNMNHEQAAGMAALAYAQLRGLGVCLVTTGCGGTNAITALLHAWQDNIPCVFVSGQAERNHTIRNSEIALRQFGRQEADIISIVSSISKYAVMINDPRAAPYEVMKALYIANSGRKGPVWIDVPLDVQSSIIDVDSCNRYESKDEILTASDKDVEQVIGDLERSKKPIILAGNGINLAGAKGAFRDFIRKVQIPVVHSRLGCDLLATDDPLSIGMIGMLGASRAGNFALQNSDYVLSIGCRLSINTTGYDYAQFANNAKLTVVDIDAEEHKKRTVEINQFIHADAKDFIERISTKKIELHYVDWAKRCLHWKQTMPILSDDDRSHEKIDMYDLAERISNVLPDDAIVVSDAGDGYYIGTSGFHYKETQRAITSAGQAEMGFALPGAIGLAFATQNPILAFIGDGSFMMNLQELATVAQYNLPLKIVITNNNGYASVRGHHIGTFRRYVGCDPEHGLGLVNFEKLAKAFGIPYARIGKVEDIEPVIENAMDDNTPYLCEAICTERQKILDVVTERLKKS